MGGTESFTQRSGRGEGGCAYLLQAQLPIVTRLLLSYGPAFKAKELLTSTHRRGRTQGPLVNDTD